MSPLCRLGLVIWRNQVRIPVEPDICHRGCAYIQCSKLFKRLGVYSAAYGTVHYKEPLKSFETRVGLSPSFGLLPVTVLPWLYRKRREAIYIHSLTHLHIKYGINPLTAKLFKIFTHLRLCLADAIHNFKWVQIIQIWQNGGQLFLNLAGWCHILSLTYLKRGT